MAAVSVATNSGPWSTSFYGNGIKSDGYRVNNALDQRNGVGNINYTTPGLTAFLTVTGDDQKLGFPGGRLVDPSIGLNELVTNRTRHQHAVRLRQPAGRQRHRRLHQDRCGTAPNSSSMAAFRERQTQSGFFGATPPISFASTYNDADLKTWSITPRLSIKNVMFGMPSQILTGIDYYDTTFHQTRGAFRGVAPYHAYNMTQQTVAGYWQQTVGLLPTTDFSYGARIQNTHLNATDRYDPHRALRLRRPGAPARQQRKAICPACRSRTPFQQCIFGVRPRRARVPHSERRRARVVGTGVRCVLQSAVAELQAEDPDLARHRGRFPHQGGRIPDAIEHLQHGLENEIHFNPVVFFNVNLDPTRRYGSETSASLRVSDSVLLRGGVAYTRAVFREGMYAGNDVPLVSRYTASGGVTWNIWQNYLVADATVRAWSERFMDNDQTNTQRRIPADATIDFKLSGAYEHFFWSLSVNNVLNALYYDYAIASTFTPGRFSAYPLPGRTYMVKAGATF